MIVVDDGATEPGTLEAFERLPAGATLLHQPNAGVSAARNAGAAAAGTPLLLMLDADDRLRPGALAALRGPLDADPGSASPTATQSSSAPGPVGSPFPTTTPTGCSTARRSRRPA